MNQYYRNPLTSIIPDNSEIECKCGMRCGCLIIRENDFEIVVIISCLDNYMKAFPYEQYTYNDAQILHEFGDEIQSHVFAFNGEMYETDAKHNVREWDGDHENGYRIISLTDEVVGYAQTRDEAEKLSIQYISDDIQNGQVDTDYWVTWED